MSNIRISDLDQVADSTTAKLLIDGVFPFSQKNVSNNNELTTYRATFQQLLDLFTALNSSTYILPPGLIMPYGGASTADIKPLHGWKICNGDLLPKAGYLALYGVIGDTYGGAAGDNRYFKLPDLRGRTLIGAGKGTNLQNYTRGTSDGFEAVALTTSQMPIHSHTYEKMNVEASNNADATSTGGINIYNSSTTLYTSENGSGASHPNMQPYTVINYIIKT